MLLAPRRADGSEEDIVDGGNAYRGQLLSDAISYDLLRWPALRPFQRHAPLPPPLRLPKRYGSFKMGHEYTRSPPCLDTALGLAPYGYQAIFRRLA